MDYLRASWLGRLAANLRYGARQARRHPAFAAAVTLTLGLGIGANAAVFSALDAVLLRPLPFPDGDRLVRVQQHDPKTPIVVASPARLADWTRLNHTFTALTGYYTEDVSETSGELPEKLTRAFVAPGFLDVWGVAPEIGRDFTADEMRAGGPVAILISDALWRRRLNADPAAVGRPLRFGAASAVVVGVLPPTFAFPIPDVDVWWPVAMNASLAQFRQATWYTVVGRMKPGMKAAAAEADLAIVQRQLAVAYPATDAGLSVSVRPLVTDLVGSTAPSLYLLFAAATILLAIACVNVAGLLLVRAADRQHELSIRSSLGASPAALAEQLVTEAAVLAAAGLIVGLAIASAAAQLIRVYGHQFPRLDEIRVDGRVMLYGVGVAIATTLACSLVPVWRIVRGRITHAGAASRTQVSARGRAQWLLTGAQVTLAVVLLAAGGLLVRSIHKLAQVSPGFDPARIITFHVSGSYAETTDYGRLTRRIDRTLDALRAIPGVDAAATAGALPGVPGRFLTNVTLAEGRSDSEPPIVVDSRYVSASYFGTLGIPFVNGDACRQTSLTTIESAVVNRTFARTYFGDTSPVGYHLNADGFGTPAPVLIQGVVADVREQGLDRAPVPTVYWCFAAPGPAPFFLVRTAIDPAVLTATLRRTLKGIEPARAVFGITPLADHLESAYAETRLRTIVLAAFAAIALVLASVGVYGTLSYLVASRRREVGLRLALGATRGQVLRRFFAQGVLVAAGACAAGVAISLVVTRGLATMLYGVAPSDPITLVGVIAVVLAGAAVASFVPAARGARVEPMDALRRE